MTGKTATGTFLACKRSSGMSTAALATGLPDYDSGRPGSHEAI
jgi:hypothetical protein